LSKGYRNNNSNNNNNHSIISELKMKFLRSFGIHALSTAYSYGRFEGD